MVSSHCHLQSGQTVAKLLLCQWQSPMASQVQWEWATVSCNLQRTEPRIQSEFEWIQESQNCKHYGVVEGHMHFAHGPHLGIFLSEPWNHLTSTSNIFGIYQQAAQQQQLLSWCHSSTFGSDKAFLCKGQCFQLCKSVSTAATDIHFSSVLAPCWSHMIQYQVIIHDWFTRVFVLAIAEHKTYEYK